MVTLLAFVFVLGMLVFVHELGHFLVAKWAGVRVEVFALGFGPRLLSVVRGETEYCVCAVPLGGYVKMTGQEDLPGEGTGLTGADHEFPSKPWWQRLLIAAAGPWANFVAAFVLFFGVFFFLGIPQVLTNNDTTVKEVSQGYPAEGVLRSGDRITAVNGVPVKLWRDMVPLIQNSESGSVEIEFERGGEKHKAKLDLRIEKERRLIGIATRERPVLGEIQQNPELPAANRYLRSGDRILAIDSQPIQSWTEFRTLIAQSPEKELKLEIERKKPFQVEILTSSELGDDLGRYGVELSDEKRVAKVAPGSRAEEAGLLAGDEILGQRIVSIPFLKKLFRSVMGEDVQETLVVEVRRPEPFTLAITPIRNPVQTDVGLLGVGKQQGEIIIHRFLLSESLQAATERFVWSSTLVFSVLKKLVMGELSPSKLAGPVGIMQVTGKQAEKGLSELLLLAAILSVNLAIVNLLPIPILDGSHIILCVVEGIQRKPVNDRLQGVLQYIGLAILLPFILYVTVYDIIRWIREIIS